MRDPVNQYHSPEADIPAAEDSTDRHIIDRLFARSEEGLALLQTHYGKLCHRIALNLLGSREDAEECVNDTYLDAWNAMPTARPTYLGAFLSKITRRISIDRFRNQHRQKRGGIDTVLEELNDCIPSDSDVVKEYESQRLASALNRFLYAQPTQKRVMFLRRYFYSQSIGEIAHGLGVAESTVKVTLYRLREALRKELEEQDLL